METNTLKQTNGVSVILTYTKNLNALLNESPVRQIPVKSMYAAQDNFLKA